MAPRKYLLVAAMPTPNGALHLGHVGAQYLPLDVFRRYQEQQGNRVAYYGGFDVFDNAVCIAAQRNGRTPQEHAALVTTQITDPEREPWAQQLSRRYTHHSQLAGILEHVEDVPEALYSMFNFRVTPYMAQLMDPIDPLCPIRRQYLPTSNELVIRSYEVRDSLAEDNAMGEPGSPVVHRYPQRVLFLVQNTCGAYCRYCTRKRMVSDADAAITGHAIDACIRYIASHREIEDVLLSGGDPLILSDRKLDAILATLRAEAPHVRLLRIGSRLPVQLPTRITDALCELLSRHNVQMVNLHINHPKEITPLLVRRLAMLRRAGVMLGNQSVLLRGVNDSVAIQRELCMRLVEIGVRPYYVYSNDSAQGNWQFTVPLAEMTEIARGLRGWISGPAVPTFVVDGTGGLGKMPVLPAYVMQDGETGEVWATNYEGLRSRQRNLERAANLQLFERT
ncbi:KamA family radical SAM protein [Paraburkholderia fungorum]|uniref:KamA family radical SAM protein n=1 Tax=Paraburkholderia fungorum TaxID=134537 RepID=UPI0038B828F4